MNVPILKRPVLGPPPIVTADNVSRTAAGANGETKFCKPTCELLKSELLKLGVKSLSYPILNSFTTLLDKIDVSLASALVSPWWFVTGTPGKPFEGSAELAAPKGALRSSPSYV